MTERRLIDEARATWIGADEHSWPFVADPAHMVAFQFGGVFVGCSCGRYLSGLVSVDVTDPVGAVAMVDDMRVDAIRHVVESQLDLRHLDPLPDVVRGPVVA